jgi:hypothetical protein
MNHLDGSGEDMMSRRYLAASTRDQEDERGTQTLAFVMSQVSEQAIDAGPVRFEMLPQDAFDFFKIAGNWSEEMSGGASL